MRPDWERMCCCMRCSSRPVYSPPKPEENDCEKDGHIVSHVLLVLIIVLVIVFTQQARDGHCQYSEGGRRADFVLQATRRASLAFSIRSPNVIDNDGADI